MIISYLLYKLNFVEDNLEKIIKNNNILVLYKNNNYINYNCYCI